MGARGGGAAVGSDPATAHGFGKERVPEQQASSRVWWHELRNHAISVGHQYPFATRRQTDIFTEFILEGLKPNGAHGGMVAPRGYFVKNWPC